jgi:NAD(P)H-flavin reductase
MPGGIPVRPGATPSVPGDGVPGRASGPETSGGGSGRILPNPTSAGYPHLPALPQSFTTTPVPGAAPGPYPGTPPGAATPGGAAPTGPAPGTPPGNSPTGTTPTTQAPGTAPGGSSPGTTPGAPAPAQLPGSTTPAVPNPGAPRPPVPGSPVPGTPVPGTPVPAAPTPGTSLVPAPLQGAITPRPGATTPYPPGAGPWAGGVPAPPVTGSSTEAIGAIPAIGGPRATGPQWPGEPVQATSPFGRVRLPSFVAPVEARPALPADGMDPADDAALHDLARLLGNSLSLAGGPEEVAGRLRAALAQAQPALFTRLPGSPAVQAEQLAEALTWLVHQLDQPPVLVTACGRLGAALAECGVLPQHLQLTGAALAEAMRAGMAAGGWRQDFDQAWRSTWQHAYQWIVHGMTAAVYQPTVWTAVVVGHERRRDDLAVVRLRPYLPMPYRPGQYARIEVPAQPGIWRPYSLTGSPRQDTIVELHVRAKSHNGVSGALVYGTAVGDTVRIARAEGEMGLPESGPDLLMIAGDTGVVPLKALLTELAATGDPRSAVLFWGVRDLNELYDIDDIAAIARACRRATVIPVISEGEAGPYASGLVTDAVAAYGEWSEHEVYLAGPPLMLAATSLALQELGVHPERIHHDKPE